MTKPRRRLVIAILLLLPILGTAAWAGYEYLVFHGDVERIAFQNGEAALQAEREAIGASLARMRKKDWFGAADLPREVPPADPEANARRVAFYLHDPLPILVQMDCPLLAGFGAEDRLVDTAESVRHPYDASLPGG